MPTIQLKSNVKEILKEIKESFSIPYIVIDIIDEEAELEFVTYFS